MTSEDRLHVPGFRPAEPPVSTDGEAPTGTGATAPSPPPRSVRRRVELDAPADDVWRALTDPDELAAWWGEGSQLDATRNGEGRFVEEGEPVRLARVVEVRPGRRLVLDWWPEDPDAEEPASRVTIEVIPKPSGTVVT